MLRNVLRRLASINDVHPRAMLLEPWKAVYLPIPKTACTSMKAFFAAEIEAHEGRPLPRRGDGTPLFPALRKSVVYRSGLYPYLYGDYCTFALVRDPYNRVLSFYRNKIESPDAADARRFHRFRPGSSFRECVETMAAIPDAEANHDFRSQASYLLDRSGHFLPDIIGKFENLDSDVNRIVRRIGMDAARLERLNATGPAEFDRYFDRDIMQLVESRYERDFELLGYPRRS